MPLYLIRHADAGRRSAWQGDDADRPLSSKGRKQAQAIEAVLATASIGRIVSSPSRRCVETVEPLAQTLGLEIATSAALLEGGRADDVVTLLLGLADESPLLCSHGDLIPKVLRRLSAAGMRTTEPHEAKKGSVWVLEMEEGRVTRGSYVLPGAKRELAS